MSGRQSDAADSLAAVRAAFDPERFRRDGQAIVGLLADHLARAQAGGDGAPMPVLPWLAPDASVAHWRAALAGARGEGSICRRCWRRWSSGRTTCTTRATWATR